MTSTVEQARAALDAMKYPPLGKRSCGMPIAYERHEGTMTEQITAANARTVYVPLIETAEGVENADAIAALEGVDAIWVGQLDLSISLGIPNQLDHPLFLSAIERVATAGRRYGKTMAILAATVSQGRAFYEIGYDMICFSEDTLIFRNALSAGLSELRAKLP
jgi:2-dehydro-3-deoxyglucarate aldolase/4-hydroxy-2-oxoheptanedioate aldolase